MVEIEKKQENTWGMLCHLSALAMFVFPFGNIVAPLIIWLIKKNEIPLVDTEGKKVLNFQITMSIYAIIAGLLCFVLIGFILLPALVLANVVLLIIAAIKTTNGETYKYPFTIEFIK